MRQERCHQVLELQCTADSSPILGDATKVLNCMAQLAGDATQKGFCWVAMATSAQGHLITTRYIDQEMPRTLGEHTGLLFPQIPSLPSSPAAHCSQHSGQNKSPGSTELRGREYALSLTSHQSSTYRVGMERGDRMGAGRAAHRCWVLDGTLPGGLGRDHYHVPPPPLLPAENGMLTWEPRGTAPLSITLQAVSPHLPPALLQLSFTLCSCHSIQQCDYSSTTTIASSSLQVAKLWDVSLHQPHPICSCVP